jgi:hypothetical protein
MLHIISYKKRRKLCALRSASARAPGAAVRACDVRRATAVPRARGKGPANFFPVTPVVGGCGWVASEAKKGQGLDWGQVFLVDFFWSCL